MYLTIRKRLQYVNQFPRAGKAASMTDAQSLMHLPAPRSTANAMAGALIEPESVPLSKGLVWTGRAGRFTVFNGEFTVIRALRRRLRPSRLGAGDEQ